MPLSVKFLEALTFANAVHGPHKRKGTSIPYITHLMSVGALVIEYGGSEKQAIAGLLHDSIEDRATAFGGVEKLRREIKRRFGPEVLRIVDACTDTVEDPKPDWKPRKEAYLRHLAKMDRRVALVSCCDKLHNARSIISDYRRIGAAVFERFSASKQDTLWYYGALADTYDKHHTIAASTEFAASVREMRRLADA